MNLILYLRRISKWRTKMDKILIIEDDPDLRELLSESIREVLLVEVLEADSYESALILIQEQEVGAIVCDYNLGQSNGLDLYERIKEYDIPFILLTGQVFESNDEALSRFQSGEKSILREKPIEDDVLINDLKLFY